MPSYKLLYFNGRGRGEIIRLMLALAGQKFEDHRMELGSDEWKALKPQIISQQLSAIEIDGGRFVQSVAIATYIAREYGLYGKNTLEAFRIDQIIGIIQDYLKQYVIILFAEPEKKIPKV